MENYKPWVPRRNCIRPFDCKGGLRCKGPAECQHSSKYSHPWQKQMGGAVRVREAEKAAEPFTVTVQIVGPGEKEGAEWVLKDAPPKS